MSREVTPQDVQRLLKLVKRLEDIGSDASIKDARAIRNLIDNSPRTDYIERMRTLLRKHKYRADGGAATILDRMIEHFRSAHKDVAMCRKLIADLIMEDDAPPIERKPIGRGKPIVSKRVENVNEE